VKRDAWYRMGAFDRLKGETERVSANEILEALKASGVQPSSLAIDSREVRRGDVFLAYPGIASDGRRFIAQAIANGASAVVWERTGFAWDAAWRVPNVAVDGLKGLAGYLAHEVYDRPSQVLWTMGVTGTNGKTSCSQWLAQACTIAGARTGVVGTLGVGFPSHPADAPATLRPTANTTPDAVELHRSLAGLLAEGAQGVAMEVSSIGLEQGRVNGIHFGAALFTNLSRDHLDYHGDMESYARAKQMLFQSPGLAHAVVNLDDVQGVQIARMLAGSRVNRVGYSAYPDVASRSGLESFLEAHDLRLNVDGLAFELRSSWGDARIESPLLGRFNASNLLGVLGMMLVSGVPFASAVGAIALLQPVTGRMQKIGGDGRPLVVVDYAHTPDALEKTLAALRDSARTAGGRLLAVFGCGGDRDRGKRSLMGAVASRHADLIVVTSDNPRGEDPEAIIDEIEAGVTVAHERIVDRRSAIAHAVAAASAADIVLLAGKGHETYQEIAGVRHPFSDVDEARHAIAHWQPGVAR
jgi:UDP-N-acetylmuramoyl-L-alanyl-D-glutamate--2,6-diaminopimelate ligase